MKKVIAFSISILCGVAVIPLSHAVTTARDRLNATALPVTTTSVERGGTVHAVDQVKGTIAVDDGVYKFDPKTLLIHPSPRSGASKLSVMPIGSKIQFRTLRTAPSNQETVMEIWVVK